MLYICSLFSYFDPGRSYVLICMYKSYNIFNAIFEIKKVSFLAVSQDPRGSSPSTPDTLIQIFSFIQLNIPLPSTACTHVCPQNAWLPTP